MLLTSASVLPLLAGTQDQLKIWVSELIKVVGKTRKVARSAIVHMVTMWAAHASV